MLSKILSLLMPNRNPVVKLERREPVLFTDVEDEGFEAQLQKEFANTSPTASLNPAYLQSMTQATQPQA